MTWRVSGRAGARISRGPDAPRSAPGLPLPPSLSAHPQVLEGREHSPVAADVGLQPELAEDRAHDGLDRLDAQVQTVADRGVREPLREQLEHLTLAGCELLESAGSTPLVDDPREREVLEHETRVRGQVVEEPGLRA